MFGASWPLGSNSCTQRKTLSIALSAQKPVTTALGTFGPATKIASGTVILVWFFTSLNPAPALIHCIQYIVYVARYTWQKLVLVGKGIKNHISLHTIGNRIQGFFVNERLNLFVI